MNLSFGCMTFGNQVDEKAASEILQLFKEHQNQYGGPFDLDTAYIYTDGKSEDILGRLLTPQISSNLYLATKVNPKINGLTPESIRKQLETSLARLQRTSVDLLYLHSPDPNTPIEDTLRECHKLHTEGKFKELGLSNYASWQVVNIWHICNRNGWVKPTVYQGMYNLLTRSVEKELFPALRMLGIRFYVYNPLAGGLLTGKHTNEIKQGSRFTLPGTGDMYKQRYWNSGFLGAMEVLEKAITNYNQNTDKPISLLEVAFTWLIHHSKMQQNDKIIIGASSVDQFISNLKVIHTPALPESILSACEEAHTLCIPHTPSYFR